MSANGTSHGAAAGAAAIVVYAQRERARSLIKAAFPRRRTRIVLTRTFDDFDAAFKTHLVDAAVVDVGAAQEETWRVASRAREYPSAPFFAIAPLRASEGPALAQCASYEFADVLVDGVDDGAARDIVGRLSYSSRFSRALDEPPRALELDTPLQRSAWRFIVSHGGRPVRTSTLAEVLRVTREHLSLFRGGRTKLEANNRSRTNRRRSGVSKESGLRSPRRREDLGVRVVVAPVEHCHAGRRHQAYLIDSTSDGRPGPTIRQRAR